ncbi:MAG: DUF4956 domain-containing protein [Candidatus Marinimicrobia bacterium]|nr:DUF4956 domain-containing protein [Candidatus Neomarinimicrobiota bacterium]
MTNEISNILINTINPAQFVFNLLVAFMAGLIISAVYRLAVKGPNYSISYLNSLIILSMITAVIIMVIGNNLARAFGLVGAMSIIRFRTAVKDILDIIFIFFSLAVGMAAGVSLHFVAMGSAIIIGLVFIMLSKLDFIYPKKKEILVQFSYEKDGREDRPYIEVFKNYCKTYDLINVKSLGDRELLEISYYVYLGKNQDPEALIRALRAIEGVNYANLLFDEEKF